MAEPLSPEAPTSPPATVLLVEDDLVLAATLVKYLMAHDHDVLSAPSAEAASAALRAGLRPSVVLLDLNLPGESGWAFLRSGILAQAGQPCANSAAPAICPSPSPSPPCWRSLKATEGLGPRLPRGPPAQPTPRLGGSPRAGPPLTAERRASSSSRISTRLVRLHEH